MAVFDKKSRYAKPKPVLYEATDYRGRKVFALPVPDAPAEVSVGEQIRKDGQRLDHLASGLIKDPNGYWRIAELNDVVLPDALAQVERIKIPSTIR